MTFHHNVEFIVKYRFIRGLCYFYTSQKTHFSDKKSRGLSTTAEILPPLRGSIVNILFAVGYVCFAHFTHG